MKNFLKSLLAMSFVFTTLFSLPYSKYSSYSYSYENYKIHGRHFIVDFLPEKNQVILEDESVWDLRYEYDFKYWDNQPLILMENDSFIGNLFGYNYKLVKISDKSSIEVQIALGPMIANPNFLGVADVNFLLHKIKLSDGSIWNFDPSEAFLVRQWEANDGIMIGTNKQGFLHTPYKNFLVNINMLHNVKVNQEG